MKIRGAIGFVIVLVVLKFLLWDVFGAFEDTLVRGFGLANVLINKAEITAESGGGLLQIVAPQIK